MISYDKCKDFYVLDLKEYEIQLTNLVLANSFDFENNVCLPDNIKIFGKSKLAHIKIEVKNWWQIQKHIVWLYSSDKSIICLLFSSKCSFAAMY